MARRQRWRVRLRRWQRDAATVAFSLFPMLVMAGLFSPAVVHVEREPDDSGPGRPRILELAGDGARHPLLIPRDFSAGFIPELLDLERLFDGGGPSLEARRLARVLAFSRHDGASIVLGDLRGSLPGLLFADALARAAARPTVAAQRLPFDHPILPIHGPGYVPFLNGGPSGVATRGQIPPPVPEPATATLVGLGLAWLALRAGRRGRRRGYLQPITS